MKRGLILRFVFMLGFALSVVSVGFSQESKSQVKYISTTHNFGKIKEIDGSVSCTFEYTNISKEPFIIDFISVSCGCTTPEYTKAPVLPGKTGKINVTFNPAGKPGVFSKDIIITSNNRKERVTLRITGEVIGKPRTPEDDFPVVLSSGLRVNSSSFLFGYLPRGRKATQAVDIYNGSNETINLGYNIISGEKNAIDIKMVPASLKPKTKGQILVTYDVTTADLWGLINTVFEVKANGKSVSEKFNAYATVTEDFSRLSPDQLKSAPRADFSSQFFHFGDVKRTENLSHEFTITNSGESTLYFRSIKPNSSSITYTIDKMSLKKGETATLKATLKSPATGRISESITIIVNDPARPMREIRLAGSIIQ